MYIVAIGWLYVISVISLTAKSFFMGMFVFLFVGLAPVVLLTYLVRPRRKAKEEDAEEDAADPGQDA